MERKRNKGGPRPLRGHFSAAQREGGPGKAQRSGGKRRSKEAGRGRPKEARGKADFATTCLRRPHFCVDRNGGKSQQRARPFVNPQRTAAPFCGALLCVCLPAAVWFALLPAANAVGCTSIVRPWKSPRDRTRSAPHNQRTAKNRRFFDGHGNALLGVENHRRTHSRFVGIPKGSPFGASFSILSVRAESMAPGGPGPSGSLCFQRRTL